MHKSVFPHYPFLSLALHPPIEVFCVQVGDAAAVLFVGWLYCEGAVYLPVCVVSQNEAAFTQTERSALPTRKDGRVTDRQTKPALIIEPTDSQVNFL